MEVRNVMIPFGGMVVGMAIADNFRKAGTSGVTGGSIGGAIGLLLGVAVVAALPKTQAPQK